jgi:hypothetical protein
MDVPDVFLNLEGVELSWFFVYEFGVEGENPDLPFGKQYNVVFWIV